MVHDYLRRCYHADRNRYPSQAESVPLFAVNVYENIRWLFVKVDGRESGEEPDEEAEHKQDAHAVGSR